MLMQSGIGYPNAAAIEKFKTYTPGVQEIIWNPIYDIQTYNAAGHTSLTFFQRAVGSSGVTIAGTNLDVASTFPSGQSFLITGVEVQLYSDEADLTNNGATVTTAPLQFEEYYKVLTNGALKLTIGQKPYLTAAPLCKLAPRQYFDGPIALGYENADNSIDLAYSGINQVRGTPFDVVPMLIDSNRNFNVQLTWDSAETITTAARIGVTLNGYLKRSAQ